MSDNYTAPPKNPSEKYFVGSNGDAPERLYFDRDAAFADEHTYVDSFDTDGKRVEGYKFTEDGYTTSF